MNIRAILRGIGGRVRPALLAGLCSFVAVSDLHAQPFAYIPNYYGRTVSVVDTATNTVTATVPAVGMVSGNPGYVAMHPDGTRVYLTSQHPYFLVIDTASNAVIATVNIGGPNAAGIAVSPDGTRVYFSANHYTNAVGAIAVFDTATNTEILPRVRVGVGPNGVAVSPDSSRVYVVNQYSGTVSVIDAATRTVSATVRVGSMPLGVAVNPAGTRVYVTNRDSNSVSVIDTATNVVTDTVVLGSGPVGIAFNPSGTRAYVGNSFAGTVSIIDTATNLEVLPRVTVGTWPYGIDVHPTGDRVYVANAGSNNLSVIETAGNTVVATVPVGSLPISVGKFIQPQVSTNAPPTADAGPDQPAVECTGLTLRCAMVTLDGTESRDPDDDTLTYSWEPGTLTGPVITPILPLGTHAFTLTVDDGRGGIDTDEMIVTVVDTTPPAISGTTASPSTLWPPNHQMIEVLVTVDASDLCAAGATCAITDVVSNEPDNGPGDGNVTNDVVITGELTVQLRAERSGQGNGRTYTVHIKCVDETGNASVSAVAVSVPKSQGKMK